MPADIRNFFGGSSQEKAPPKEPTPKKKPQGRLKRAVLSDSEDEEPSPKLQKKKTPVKVAAKAPDKEMSSVGEETTTSDYFAKSGKAKPTRSSPSNLRGSNVQQNGSHAENGSTSRSKRPTRASKAKLATQKKELDDTFDGDHGDVEFQDDDFDAKDVDDSEIEEIPQRKATRSAEKASKARPNGKVKQEAVLDTPSKSLSKSTPKSAAKGGSGRRASTVSTAQTNGGHKRKAGMISEVDVSEDEVQSPKKRAKSAPKLKATEPTKDENSKSAVEDIFDSIPIVRPPTPPPRDPNQKFDWKTAQRSAEVPAAGQQVELPQGAENCLAGLTFVFTGVLSTLDRTAGAELVKQYGGKVTTAPSTKTSWVVLGTDAGPKKLETIKQHKLRTIDENGLFELIKRLPPDGGDSAAAEKFAAKKQKQQEAVEQAAAELEAQEQKTLKKASPSNAQESSSTGASDQGHVNGSSPTIDDRLWTVKYAPSALNHICGNKTQVEKLQTWLRMWPMNSRTHFKKGGKDGSGTFKAVMLHGPPGIGKTTSAHLAAKLEGYDIVESNASDVRSKKLIESSLRGVLDTTSIMGYFAGDGKQVEGSKKKLVLIMDEVDGMSTGDYGGVGAMAALCRKTSIPIICICNDRKLQKMKPFDSAVFEISFKRPTVEQIRQRIMTICFREKLSIPVPVINALIEGTHADIRQIINMLSTAKLDQESMDFEQGKKMSKSWEKHIILRPWDIVGKILGGQMFAPSSTVTLGDKIELYFNDFEISPLMLQENYLGTRPMLANSLMGKAHQLKVLELSEMAAASISDGDLVDRMIHGSQQQWSLMPTHAIFSFVRPASFVSGSMAGSQSRFPSWLGQNSKTGKFFRLVKEIHSHMRLNSSGDRHEIRQQYYSMLWHRLVKKLEIDGKDAVPDIIELMDSYYLTKEDWDALFELGVGKMSMEKMQINTQAKSAFTRMYNQQSHPIPFMKASQVLEPKKKSKQRPELEEAFEESDSGGETGDEKAVASDEEPLDLKKDKYVKVPKKSAAKGKGAPGKGKGKAADADENGQDDYGDAGANGKGKTKGKSGSRAKGKK